MARCAADARRLCRGRLSITYRVAVPSDAATDSGALGAWSPDTATMVAVTRWHKKKSCLGQSSAARVNTAALVKVKKSTCREKPRVTLITLKSVSRRQGNRYSK